ANGAGKRMVHNCKVKVFGKDAFKDAPKNITYLGTEWANNPIVRGDVLVSHLLSNMGGDKYPERRDELINILDIDPKWRMHQVSDGERRRVQLVLGLIQPWNLLLMDEVTVDLDVLVRSDLLNFLKNETEARKATIVYATHIFDGLGDWPSHIAHIKQLITYLRRNMVSPLLKVVEQWLREDLRELRLQAEERKKLSQDQDKGLLGNEKPRTKWDDLSENVTAYGDKYYNYWNH
ncbi:21937_t:CDS:2, partial [Dentiscutata erythropus]